MQLKKLEQVSIAESAQTGFWVINYYNSWNILFLIHDQFRKLNTKGRNTKERRPEKKLLKKKPGLYESVSVAYKMQGQTLYTGEHIIWRSQRNRVCSHSFGRVCVRGCVLPFNYCFCSMLFLERGRCVLLLVMKPCRQQQNNCNWKSNRRYKTTNSPDARYFKGKRKRELLVDSKLSGK